MPRLHRRPLFAAAATLLLSGCGGDSGSSAPPIAAPAPAPSPSPTPTPPPTATATARFYGISATTGRINFYTTRDLITLTAIGFTSREGFYFPGFARAIVGRTSGNLSELSRDNSDRFKTFAGVDHETGLGISMVAPDYAKVITPLTSELLESGTEQRKLKTQFGLQRLGGVFSPFVMATDPDLATYDAVAELASTDSLRQIDATRMIEANLRSLALYATRTAFSQHLLDADGVLKATAIGLANGGGGQCLREAPPDNIFLGGRLLPIVQCWLAAYNAPLPPQLVLNLRPDTVQAVAHLLTNYTLAIGVRPDRLDLRKAYLLGIKGYLVPAIAKVIHRNDAATAAAALATSLDTVTQAVLPYRDAPGYNPTGLFQPQTDFIVMAAGSTFTITSDRLTGNDYQFDGGSSGLGGLGVFSILLSVSVPAVNQANLAVSRSGDNISITVASGFQGVTWFEYLARGEFAEERTVRVYIRVD